MIGLAQHLINGIVIGGTYAMMGVGLTLVFGVMGLVNFAHGEAYMVAAFLLYTGAQLLNLPYLAGFALALAGSAVLAYLWERGALRRLYDKPEEAGLLATIGLSVLLQNLALLIWGGTPKSIPDPIPVSSISLGPLQITPARLLIVLIALAVILGLAWWMQKTRLGKAVRATFQDREIAAANGVDVRKVYSLVFIGGSLLTALAGVLLAPIFVVTPNMGVGVTNKSFVIGIVGGLGNFTGAVIAGLVIGITESLTAAYFGGEVQDAVGFLIAIVIMLLRPRWLSAGV